MKSNIFHTNFNSNAPPIGKDMAILYSIVTFTLSILCFIFYWFVSKIISGGSLPSLFLLPKGNIIYLYLFINLTYTVYRYCVTSGWFPISLGFRYNDVSLYNCFLLFGMVSLLLFHYETEIYFIYYLLLFGIEILLYIGDIIMPIIFWCKLLLSLLYLVEQLGIYDFYSVYRNKLALCNYALKQLESTSHLISYLVNIARLACTIIYVISIASFIYKCMQSSLSYLDLLQFILFIYSLYKTIYLCFTTHKVCSNYMYYMKLLFYLIAMFIFLPAFLKVISVIFTIINIIGKGKGKAPDPPSSGSNPSSPSSPPSGPNPPPSRDSVPVHDNSNMNNGEEEGEDNNTWEPYNMNAWENAFQENENVTAGPSETYKERRNRVAREKRAARTPEKRAKDKEKADARAKKRYDSMPLDKKQAIYEKSRNLKKNRTQEKVEWDREKYRLRSKYVKGNMTEQEREEFFTKYKYKPRNNKVRDSLDEPEEERLAKLAEKETLAKLAKETLAKLAEERKLESAIRAEKAWKKKLKLKRDQKKDKDDKTSKKK